MGRQVKSVLACEAVCQEPRKEETAEKDGDSASAAGLRPCCRRFTGPGGECPEPRQMPPLWFVGSVWAAPGMGQERLVCGVVSWGAEKCQVLAKGSGEWGLPGALLIPGFFRIRLVNETETRSDTPSVPVVTGIFVAGREEVLRVVRWCMGRREVGPGSGPPKGAGAREVKGSSKDCTRNCTTR